MEFAKRNTKPQPTSEKGTQGANTRRADNGITMGQKRVNYLAAGRSDYEVHRDSGCTSLHAAIRLRAPSLRSLAFAAELHHRVCPVGGWLHFQSLSGLQTRVSCRSQSEAPSRSASRPL